MRGMGKRNENLLPDEIFVGASLGRKEAPSVNCGILVVHAGRDGEGQFDRIMRYSHHPVGRHLRTNCAWSFRDGTHAVGMVRERRRWVSRLTKGCRADGKRWLSEM